MFIDDYVDIHEIEGMPTALHRRRNPGRGATWTTRLVHECTLFARIGMERMYAKETAAHCSYR